MGFLEEIPDFSFVGIDYKKSLTESGLMSSGYKFSLTHFTEDELKKMEVDYRHLDVLTSFNCPLSLVLNRKDFKPYCALVLRDTNVKHMTEGLVCTYDAEKVKKILTNSKNRKLFVALRAPWWLERLQQTPRNARSQILKYFPLKSENVLIVQTPDNENYIYIAFPDIEDNEAIIDRAMTAFGYFPCAFTEDNVVNENTGIVWKRKHYEPKFQKPIKNALIKTQKCLYHISPTKYEHKIIKQGLIPKSKNNAFTYPDRIYLFLDNTRTEEGYAEMDDSMLLDITEKLFTIIQPKRDDKYVNDYEYTYYRIDVSKLRNDTNLMYDQNFIPFGIFTADNIPPEAISVIRRFDMHNVTDIFDDFI